MLLFQSSLTIMLLSQNLEKAGDVSSSWIKSNDSSATWGGLNISLDSPLDGRNISQFQLDPDITADLYDHLEIVKYTLLLPLSVILAVVDLWIVAAIVSDHKLHTYSNCFLANLAASEVTFILAVVFDAQVLLSLEDSISCGDAFAFCLITVSLGTSYFLCAVCFATDKYIKITRPLKYATIMTRKVCVFVIVLAWCFASAVGTLIALLTKFTQDCQGQVSFFKHLQKAFLIYAHTVTVPVLAITVGLNIGIIRIARRQARAIADLVPPQNSTGEATADSPRRPPPTIDKSTRYFKAFLWSFILVWLPPIVIEDIAFAVSLDKESIVWFVAIRNAVNALGLIQMLYGTIVLTLKQEQFRAVLSRNWRSLKLRFKL